MAWTNTQKQIAIRACKAAGISEEQRVDMILCHFARARHKGDITSTSPALSDQDYAEFMAIVERYAGGKILHFTTEYWQKAAADSLQRMRHFARKIAAKLEASGDLIAGGIGLAGWIEKRVSGGTARSIEELEYHGLLALILGLQAYARQRGVELEGTR